MKFSIGYNHDIGTLGLLERYKDNIEALYFPIPDNYLGSGRHVAQGDKYEREISGIIKKCVSLDIKPQLLLNATCEGDIGIKKDFFAGIAEYIKSLAHKGLKNVIVANPVYIYEIRKRFRGIEIESSINCYVKTVEHALYLRDLGVDVLTIDRDINRNIPLIREIKKKTGLKIRILLNEGCLRNCPFRSMHFNIIAHDAKSKINHEECIDPVFFEKWCTRIFFNDPAAIFRSSFIPPDALKHYVGIADYFKIASRDSSLDALRYRLEAYISQDFSGNLRGLLDCSGASPYYRYIDYSALKKTDFFDKMLKCRGDCGRCGYCSKMVKDTVVTDSFFLNSRHPKRRAERKDAIRIYKGILRSGRGEPDVYLGLAQAYFDTGRREESLKEAEKAINIFPRESAPYLALGDLYERSGSPVKALDLYYGCSGRFPDNADIKTRMCKAYLKLGKYAEALGALNSIDKSNFGRKNFNFLLGSCHEKLGNYREAIKSYKRESAINPEDFEIHFLLSRCYKKIGLIRSSEEELSRCVGKIKNNRVGIS